MCQSDKWWAVALVGAKLLGTVVGIGAALYFFLSLVPVSSVSVVADSMPEERFYAPEGRDGVGTVIVDRETGVCYLWRKDGYGAGLTLMVDAEGDPLLWDEEKP